MEDGDPSQFSILGMGTPLGHSIQWWSNGGTQAVQAGNVLYVSGSLGLDEKTMKPVEGGAAAEARQSLKNIHAILKHAGTSFDKIAKTTVLLSDINNAKFVNEVYQEFVKEPYPARSTYQVAKLPLDALVEIEVIAIVE
ncbi:rutC family protein jhp_0879-like [Rhopalosiphum padi]|uniref:rutC family protein jhp_0879-like n=1 Tax=Rhopalosiphum padi TaxID=40932 RepID=UPI00298E1F84|nr:rutC family protein jhp_0879-like [Rhopalosiphum padi]